MTARRISYPDHNDWDGTGTPTENEMWRGVEINDTKGAIDEHADLIDTTAIEWKAGVDNFKVFIVVGGVPVDYHGTETTPASIEARKTTTPGTNAAVWTKTQTGQPTPDATTMTFTV